MSNPGKLGWVEMASEIYSLDIEYMISVWKDIRTAYFKRGMYALILLVIETKESLLLPISSHLVIITSHGSHNFNLLSSTEHEYVAITKYVIECI